MTVFADSSALVKLYAVEEGAGAVRSLAEPFIVSRLARVEVESALWRKSRRGELSDQEVRLVSTAFARDWWGIDRPDRRFIAMAVAPTIIEDAVRLLAAHGLRAYDAVQLASALAARRADPECNEFACFDAQLSAAASAEGFRTLTI